MNREETENCPCTFQDFACWLSDCLYAQPTYESSWKTECSCFCLTFISPRLLFQDPITGPCLNIKSFKSNFPSFIFALFSSFQCNPNQSYTFLNPLITQKGVRTVLFIHLDQQYGYGLVSIHQLPSHQRVGCLSFHKRGIQHFQFTFVGISLAFWGREVSSRIQ